MNTHTENETYRAFVNVEGVIDGYVALWGSPEQRDAYGTWFDKEKPPEMSLDFLPVPMFYEHSMDGQIRKEIVGKIETVTFDEKGMRFNGQLDKSSPFFGRLVSEVRSGILKTSSASAEHLAAFDDDGRFVSWSLSEVSFTQYPAEDRMPSVNLIRSQEGARDASQGTQTTDNPNLTGVRRMNPILQAVRDLPDDASTDQIMTALVNAGATQEQLDAAISGMTPPENGATPTDPAQMFRESLERVVTAAEQQQAQEATAESIGQLQQQLAEQNARSARLEAQLSATRARLNAPPPDEDNPNMRRGTQGNNNANRIQVGDNLRYAHMTADDMTFGYTMMRSGGVQPSEEYVKYMTHKAVSQFEKSDYSRWSDPAAYHAVRSALPATRADELMATNIAGQGQEWVGTLEENRLWELVRQTRIWGQITGQGMWMQEVPQGTNSIEIPLEGDDPTWYTTREANDHDSTNRPEVVVGASQFQTADRTLTVGTLKCRVEINEELVEDSLIPVIPQRRRQMDESAQDIIEYVLLNGDTTTTASTNINLIDGTPSAPSGSITAPAYLATDGLLKLPLVTNTALALDAENGLDENLYLDLLAKLPNNLASNPNNLLFISDTRTNIASLKIPAIKTGNVYSQPTLETGMVGRMWSIPLLVSGQMGLAQATDGKISNTGSNNIRGRILLMVPRYWALGWKRRITFKVDEDIDSGVYKMVASMRLGVKYRSTDAAALAYNVAV